MRVRVTGFPRRSVAALFDLGLLLGLTAAVTTIVALSLGVPMPGLREVGPDLLVAGILDRNPMAVGAVGLFLGMTGLYQLYFGGMSGPATCVSESSRILTGPCPMGQSSTSILALRISGSRVAFQ